MIYRLLADLIMLSHFSFVVFAAFGGLLVLRYPAVLWLHLPALSWGIFVQWSDRICPLTPLENHFRFLGGEAGYAGDFIEHFVLKVLYPDNLTLALRYVLACLLAAINVAVYSYVLFSQRNRRKN